MNILQRNKAVFLISAIKFLQRTQQETKYLQQYKVTKIIYFNKKIVNKIVQTEGKFPQQHLQNQ